MGLHKRRLAENQLEIRYYVQSLMLDKKCRFYLEIFLTYINSFHFFFLPYVDECLTYHHAKTNVNQDIKQVFWSCFFYAKIIPFFIYIRIFIIFPHFLVTVTLLHTTRAKHFKNIFNDRNSLKLISSTCFVFVTCYQGN